MRRRGFTSRPKSRAWEAKLGCFRRDAQASVACYSRAMPREKPGSTFGDALSWASQIIAVGVAMFVPAVAGGWLDSRLGTAVLGPVGLVLGFAAGLAWLVRLTSGRGRP